MARFKNKKSQKIRFRDIADFTEGSYDLELLDIINDTVKEKVSDDFISAPGAFVYELDITVDEKKVIELGVLGFTVEIYNKNPHKKLKKDPGRGRGHSARYRRQKLREFLKTQVPKPVLFFDIDLDVPLPSNSFQFLTSNIYKPKIKKYPVFFSSAPLTNNVLNAAQITAMPIQSITKNVAKSTSFGSLAKQSMLKNNSDPVAMMTNPTPFYPTLSAKVSKASVKIDEKPDYDQSEKISLDNIFVRRSLVAEREKLKDSKDDDSKEAIQLSSAASQKDVHPFQMTLGHKAEIESTLFNVKREIEIPKPALGMRQKFYVRITPILKQEKSLIRIRKIAKSIFFSVGHKSKVEDLMLPLHPPDINMIMNKKGIVILNVKQVDPAGTRITVYKRTISPRRRIISPPKIIEKIKMEAESPSQIVSDYDSENIFPNIVLYRAIAQSPVGMDGPTSSIVVKGHFNINVPTAKEDPNELSIIAINEPNRIKIDVERIPEEIIGIKLLKEEIDESGSLSSRVRVIPTADGKTLNDTFGNVKKLTYFDYEADINRRYRYFCSFRPKLGNEFLSEEDEHIIRKKPMKPLPVEVSLQNSQVTTDDNGNFVVNIDAISIPKPEGVDFLLSILERTGVSQVFINAVKDQRAEMANLAVFVVERVNRNTGRRESFGLNSPGTFIDDAETRKRLNLSAMTPSNRYSYFFKLCLRPPQSFLKGILTKFSSGKNPGVDDKEVLAKKFLSAFATSTGAMFSDKELTSGISVGDNFRLGETGITLQLDVQTPKPKPKPSNLRISRKSRKKGILLKWGTTPGDLAEVDHCMIFVEHNGTTTLLGTRANSGRSGYFWFRERKYATQVGDKRYFVKFVYADLTVSAESNKVKHTVYASLPPAFFSRHRKIKLLGLVKGVTKKKKIVLKNQGTPSKLKLSDFSKKMGAPGWSSSNTSFNKKF